MILFLLLKLKIFVLITASGGIKIKQFIEFF